MCWPGSAPTRPCVGVTDLVRDALIELPAAVPQDLAQKRAQVVLLLVLLQVLLELGLAVSERVH